MSKTTKMQKGHRQSSGEQKDKDQFGWLVGWLLAFFFSFGQDDFSSFHC